MTHAPHPESPDGADFWRRWRATPQIATPTRLDPLLLAAWADGRLSPAEADQVEAALARDPAALDLALAARAAATDKQTPPTPLPLTRAAQALVAGRLALAARALGWAAALGGLLIVGISGYDMGAGYAAATTADSVVALASWDVGHGVDP